MVQMGQQYVERLKCLLSHSDIPQVSMDRMQAVRQAYVYLGIFLVENLPESRSKSLALTSLEDSLMRAIQSLAHTGSPEYIDLPERG